MPILRHLSYEYCHVQKVVWLQKNKAGYKKVNNVFEFEINVLTHNIFPKQSFKVIYQKLVLCNS